MAEPEGELSVLFTGDAEMKRLNRRFRGKNKTTDVLSFPAGNAPGPVMLGDVVVSVPVARRQARLTGWSLEKECFFLLLHGILHLLGYDHERGAKEARAMADIQHKLMNIGYKQRTKRR